MNQNFNTFSEIFVVAQFNKFWVLNWVNFKSHLTFYFFDHNRNYDSDFSSNYTNVYLSN